MNKKDIDVRYIKAKLRPQRIAIMVPLNANWDVLQRVIHFLTWVLGSRYCCIIPINTDNSKDNSLARSWIQNYDPDLVLVVPEINDFDFKEIFKDICQPYSIGSLSKKLEDNFRIYNEDVVIIRDSVNDLIKEINSLGVGATSHYQIVHCSQKNPDKFLYHVMFGVLEKKEAASLANNIKGSATQIKKSDDISTYINLFLNNDYPLTSLDLGIRSLDCVVMQDFINPPTIFLGSSSALDISYFWNIRAGYNLFLNNIIFVNEKVVGDNDAIESLNKWIILPRNIKSTYCKIITSPNLVSKAHSLARRLRLRVKKNGIDHVDVEKNDFFIPKVHFFKDELTVEMKLIGDNTVEFRSPPISSSGKMVLEFEKDIYTQRLIFEHAPPLILSESNHLVLNSPSPINKKIYTKPVFRYHGQNICRKIEKNDTMIRITIPTISELLSAYFSTIVIKEINDEKCTRYRAAIRLFGGLRESAISFRRKFKNVIFSFEDIPITYNQIQGVAKLGRGKELHENKSLKSLLNFIKSDIGRYITSKRWAEEKSEIFSVQTLSDFLNWLNDKNILYRRILLPKCSHCLDKENWINSVNMDGHTLCRNCGSKLIIKDKIEVGYQLNPLVKKSIDEGLIPIVLTLNFLQNLTSRGFMYLPGFKGKINKEPFDIDIIASCDGVLVFCECKNVPNTGSDWQEIKEQFEKLIRKSKKLKAQIVILSSLSKEYPEMIEELKKKYSSESLSVVLLNVEDLEKGIKYHPLRNGISFPFTISDFLPSKQTKRKKRRGKRSISYGNFL